MIKATIYYIVLILAFVVDLIFTFADTVKGIFEYIYLLLDIDTD